MTFKNLRPELQEILKQQNYVKETEIQAKALPVILAKKDIVGISRTGSGKTLAFLLPILHSLIKKNVTLHSLILIPTRELALQINELLIDLGEELGLRTSLLIGGEDFDMQKISINRNPHIIIGTPGRVAEHSLNYKHMRFIVLDETDKLIEANFKNNILTIFKKLLKDKNLKKEDISKKNFQTLLFSATLTVDFRSLIDDILFEPITIEIKETAEINESFVFIPYKYKIVYLMRCIQKYNPESCIVFVNSSTTTRMISKCLDEKKIKNKFLYGDLEQEVRRDTILNFRRGDHKILVSTDVASRGIDVPQVDLVINFDICDSKTYVHRIGRTSRGKVVGKAISLISQYEVISLQKIEYELQRKIERVSVEEVFDSEKELLDTFCRIKDACKSSRRDDGIRKKKYKKK